jgi:hypothetical protein
MKFLYKGSELINIISMFGQFFQNLKFKLDDSRAAFRNMFRGFLAQQRLIEPDYQFMYLHEIRRSDD